MSQDAIWEHFQNEGVATFDQAGPRLEYVARSLHRGERALNIGVGSGALETLALRKGVEIWSLDPSQRAIERLREHLHLGECAKVGYSQAMPFASGSFDVVIMSEVLEHLDENVREATLEEAHRVLKPGGRVTGTVPARERLEISQVVCPRCQERFHRWGHQSSFDVGSLRALLARRFLPETVHERFFNEWDSAPWPRRLTGLLKKFLSWLGLGSYGIARNIYFVARKPSIALTK